MAAQNGAGHFEGNAKMIISTFGCFVVNLIWFVVAGWRNGTLKELLPQKGLTGTTIFRNWLWSALAGTLWTMQFFFYGLGHVEIFLHNQLRKLYWGTVDEQLINVSK